MAIKSIIFDLDGTIADTEHVWFQATEDLLKKRNILLESQERAALYHQLNGFSLVPACGFMKLTLGLPDSIEELSYEMQARVADLFHNAIRFVAGFTLFHDTIIQRGLTSGIATNADDQTLTTVKKALNLEKFFGDHIYNISHVNNRYKPDPALYEHAALQLGRRPEECVAIEDSAHGIAAAQAAGMFCIGINTSKQLKQVEKANLIIDSYDQIVISTFLQ